MHRHVEGCLRPWIHRHINVCTGIQGAVAARSHVNCCRCHRHILELPEAMDSILACTSCPCKAMDAWIHRHVDSCPHEAIDAQAYGVTQLPVRSWMHAQGHNYRELPEAMDAQTHRSCNYSVLKQVSIETIYSYKKYKKYKKNIYSETSEQRPPFGLCRARLHGPISELFPSKSPQSPGIYYGGA